MSFDLKVTTENTNETFYVQVESTTSLEVVKLKISASRNLNYHDITLVYNS